MKLVAKDVINRARTILQDAGSVHWTLQELRDALNDALLEICFLKPSACAETIVMSLQEGTYQQLEDGHSQLMRVSRNITTEETEMAPRIAGPVITPIERQILDQQIPGWHDTSIMPFSPTVRHVMTDEFNPRSFYVFPGNDGTGMIEAIVAVTPTQISEPSDPNDIAQYIDEIDISPVYQSVILDYMLYRAFSKDMQIAGAAQRAVAHYQNFNNALGARRQIEAVANPDTTGAQNAS